MVASVFHAFKHEFKACFLGWHFLTTRQLFLKIGDLSSAPLSVRPIAITKGLIRCPVYRPDYLQSELSYDSVED